MSNFLKNKITLLSSAILFSSFQVQADTGLIEALRGVDVNEASFLKDSGIEVGAWVSVGYTLNSNGNTNAPISFNRSVEKLRANQFNIFIERAVNSDGDSWDIGGRVDFMAGTDALFTTAAGWDDDWTDNENDTANGEEYGTAMPQAYVEVFAPIGNGITAKMGHFYTSIGNEVVTSPDNFFYSHAYTMMYAEPFTHTGVQLSYDIDNNFSINGGVVTGWDNMTANDAAWNFLGGVSWTSDDQASSITVQLIHGEQEYSDLDDTTMYSIVATHDFSDKLHYLIQHDFGEEQNNSDAGYQKNVQWYGLNQYITYDLSEKLALGFRLEWFNDRDGVRVGNGDANYYAASVGVNYSPVSWLKLRPELRYDVADEDVFNGGADDDQIAIAMDMIVTF
jgi:hypothetical protein